MDLLPQGPAADCKPSTSRSDGTLCVSSAEMNKATISTITFPIEDATQPARPQRVCQAPLHPPLPSLASCEHLPPFYLRRKPGATRPLPPPAPSLCRVPKHPHLGS